MEEDGAPEPTAKRKRRATAREEGFTYDDKEVDESIREQARRQPKAVSLKPKPAAAARPPDIAEPESEPMEVELTAQEKSLLHKYAILAEIKEKLRRQPTEQTVAEREAERTRAARDATKAALAAVQEKQRQQDSEPTGAATTSSSDVPQSQGAPTDATASASDDNSVADFQPAKAFAGAMAGFVFKKGADGVGYYRDVPPVMDRRFRNAGKLGI